MAKTEVAKKEETLPAKAKFDYGEDAGDGFEGMTSKDLIIPFVKLLQVNSPEVGGEHDLKPGDMVNTVTMETYERLTVSLVHNQHVFVEWVPRLKGGGFVGLHSVDSDIVKKAIAANGGSNIPPEGPDGKRIPFKNGENEIIETFYAYVALLTEDGSSMDGFAVIPFSSSKIGVYRKWITALRMIRGRPPLYAARSKIGVTKDKNKKGTFFNFDVYPLGAKYADSLIDPTSELFGEIKKFLEMVRTGAARPDYDNVASDESGEGGGDMPF